MNDYTLIRPFAPDDHDTLTQLLDIVWSNDSSTSNYYCFGVGSPSEAPGFLRTLVAERNNRIVGFGSLWTNRIHPYSLYIGIIVHPQYQGQGIGTSLYTQLMTLRDIYASFPLQTATWRHCTQAIQFLKQLGFHEDKHTYMPRLQLGDISISEYQQFEEQCIAAGYRIVSLAELGTTADRDQKVVALATEIYRATHLSNPPALLSQAEWEDVVLTDIIEAGCFVVLQDDEYAGISFLHLHDEPDTLAFGWRGVAARYRTDERCIIQALVYHELNFAQQHGYTKLEAEIDTTDPWAMLLLELLPVTVEHTWITFRT